MLIIHVIVSNGYDMLIVLGFLFIAEQDVRFRHRQVHGFLLWKGKGTLLLCILYQLTFVLTFVTGIKCKFVKSF